MKSDPDQFLNIINFLYREHAIDKATMEALLASIEIMFAVLTAYDKKEIELSPEEHREYKEYLLICSAEANETRYTTQLFFDLSKSGMSLDHPEVRIDAQTLVALAREMEKLNIRIVELEKEKAKKLSSSLALFQAGCRR